MWIYIETSKDEYRLPIDMANSAVELAKRTGKKPNIIISSARHTEHGENRTFERVWVDDGIEQFIKTYGVKNIKGMDTLDLYTDYLYFIDNSNYEFWENTRNNFTKRVKEITGLRTKVVRDKSVYTDEAKVPRGKKAIKKRGK